jgi:hypothetical protein
MLDELLRYDETPLQDDFTLQVMQAVRKRQRQRRVILWGAGAVGAAFGVAGAAMLAEPLAAVFESAALPVAVGVVFVTGAVAWLFQDETLSTG